MKCGSLAVGIETVKLKIGQYYFCPQRVYDLMLAVALLSPPGTPLCNLYIWYDSSAPACCQLYVSCKFANLRLCSSTSNEKMAKLHDTPTRNVRDDVYAARDRPSPSLNFVNISVWGQTAKFKDRQYFRLYCSCNMG